MEKPQFKVGDIIVPNKPHTEGVGEVKEVDPRKKLYRVVWEGSNEIYTNPFMDIHDYYRALTPLERVLK